MKQSIIVAVCLLSALSACGQEHVLTNVAKSDNLVGDTLFPANEVTADSVVLTADSVAKKRGFLPFVKKTYEGAYELMMGCDTNYVTPQLYQFTAKAELSLWDDLYRVRSSETDKSMLLRSNNSIVLGGFLYWGIIGYGYSVYLGDLGGPKLTEATRGHHNSFVINTALLNAEYSTFSSGNSSKFVSVNGNRDFGDINRKFYGLNSKSQTLNAEYIFNHRHYSWPAAFDENALQRRSCGSWLAGFSWSHVRVEFDANLLSDEQRDLIDPSLLFDRIDYKDYSISFGYAYNWVPLRNVLVAVALSPSVGYRHSLIESYGDDMGHNAFVRIRNKLSTDLIAKASIFWNNTKYYSGLILDIHTYRYRRSTLGLTSTYGSLKYVLGFNFWKKSIYKKPKKKE